MHVINEGRKGGRLSWSRFYSSRYWRFWYFCVSSARMSSTPDIATESSPGRPRAHAAQPTAGIFVRF